MSLRKTLLASAVILASSSPAMADNPTTKQWVIDYVNNQVSKNPGPQGETGPTGADGRGGVSQAGNNISITGSGTFNSPYVISTAVAKIGDIKEGGVVACTKATGGLINLIAKQENINTPLNWSNVINAEIGVAAQSETSGAVNSAAIISQLTMPSGAAKACGDLTAGGYNDWYLPAINELNCLYTNSSAIGGFTDDNYWSSTEIDETQAKTQRFGGGFIQADYPKSEAFQVRCVRRLKA